ncbi:MAG: GIY-YIG nuclease family protein [Segetibacter sp.]
MKGYIYTLHGKTPLDIFYVGCTTNPKARKRNHVTNFPYYINDCWNTFSIVEEIEIKNRAELHKLERYYIQQFVAWGFKLVNYALCYGHNVRMLEGHIGIENELRTKLKREGKPKWVVIKPTSISMADGNVIHFHSYFDYFRLMIENGDVVLYHTISEMSEGRIKNKPPITLLSVKDYDIIEKYNEERVKTTYYSPQFLKLQGIP